MTKHGYQSVEVPFDELVCRGGDERLDLVEGRTNKYHVHPSRYQDVFNRGSCTCSPFSPDGYKAAYNLYQRLGSIGFEQAQNEQIRGIKNLINYEGHDSFHVFFAPSGSDLCYYQLLFAQLINPGKDVVNLVTCPEELGSGSISALKGQFYSDKNQFGNTICSGEPLSQATNVIYKPLPARDSSGKICNHNKNIVQIVQEHYKNYTVNANLVIGSKSGIEDNISVVSHVPEGVLWTIDLCQFRASRVLINGLLGMNCSVMLTGSKFYQTPPFCAALLVPKILTERFTCFEPEVIRPFGNIFSKYDVPAELGGIRRHLPEFHNYGLLLRWEAAIREMLLSAEVGVYDQNKVIDEWYRFTINRLLKSQYFRLMPGQDVTNKTIISFRVKAGPDTFLDYQQLKGLYDSICGGRVTGLNGYERVLFGQPVKYGDRSFIRLALGSSDLRNFLVSGFDFTNDDRLIEILEDQVEERYWKQ